MVRGPDGVNRSLRQRLSFWIAIATTCVGVIAAACSFYLSFREARELQDEQLRQTALLMERSDGVFPFWTGLGGKFVSKDPESEIIVVPAGKDAIASGLNNGRRQPTFRQDVREGFQSVRLAAVGWRFYIHTLASGTRIAVGQQTEVRDEIAIDSALRTLLPILLLVPALALLMTAIVRKALAPVLELGHQLDRRDDANPLPLPICGVPAEIVPFLTSINNLMSRVNDVMAQQRHFIADAAHELRSPLTALTLQAENLERAESPEDRATCLAQLRRGLSRACSLLEQLLSLARQRAGNNPISEVSLDGVIRRVLKDLAGMAMTKEIDLGCEQLESIRVNSHGDSMAIMARNAVDNAIRYTPAGGRVDVSLHEEDGRVVFQVVDSGPGIPEGLDKKVFEPFYRVMGGDETGSGLGLAITQSIATRLGGDVSLINREDGRGAIFRYTCASSFLK